MVGNNRILYIAKCPVCVLQYKIENKQNLIVEGCYIPFDWQKDFAEAYRKEIRYVCLIMSRSYIETHFADIKAHANAIEARLDDSSLTADKLIWENVYHLEQCIAHNCEYILIDRSWQQALENIHCAIQ